MTSRSCFLPGLASVTFRQLLPEAVVALATRSGLEAIEWGGDIHVPPGDLDRARRVGELTRSSGMAPLTYGSYYRAGQSEATGPKFASVLATANALTAERIRIWAGSVNASQADASTWQTVAASCRRVASMAADAGKQVVLEFHENSLTQTPESCRRLLEEADHPDLTICWQPLHGWGAKRNLAGIDLLAPWISGIHVFHWTPTHLDRHPLGAGADDWSAYFQRLAVLRCHGPAMLEFVVDDEPKNLAADAETLHRLLDALSPGIQP